MVHLLRSDRDHRYGFVVEFLLGRLALIAMLQAEALPTPRRCRSPDMSSQTVRFSEFVTCKDTHDEFNRPGPHR